MTAPPNLHASAVAFGPRAGVLITGPSGSGKSTLALALIAEGAQLLADDQVFLATCQGALFARAPRPIAGLIEARGVGLLRLPHRALAQLALVVDMGLPAGPRLPSPDRCDIRGVSLPCLPGRTDPCFPRAIWAMMARRRNRAREPWPLPQAVHDD